jgi:hypothetical protein
MFIVILLISTLISMVIIGFLISNMSLKNKFKIVADEYKLELKQKSIFHKPQVIGKIDGINLSFMITPVYTLNKQKSLGLVLDAQPEKRIPFNICITNETFSTKLEALRGRPDIKTGDLEFDNAFYIKGEEAGVVALLNNKTRSIIRKLVSTMQQLEITPEYIRIYMAPSGETGNTLVLKVKLICDLINEILRERSYKKLAVYNIRHDFLKSVRKRNLELLINHYKKSLEMIEDILLECLEDPSWEVRIIAAPFLGDEGKKHLFKLIEQAPLQAKIEASKILVQLHNTECIPVLKKAFRRNNSIKLKVQILRAFKSCSDTSLNDFLLRRIEDNSKQVQLEAVSALGTCGKLNAVGHLNNIVKRFMNNPSLKKAANQSIAEIHARLAKGVEAGRLSVSERETGRGSLSIADDTTSDGALSLPEDRQKRKS